MKRFAALLIALAGAIALGIMATTPPHPAPDSVPMGEFSAARAMVDVRAMSTEPHPTGSDANTRVRVYLIARLAAMGFEVTTDATPVSDVAVSRLKFWRGSDAPAPQLVNIIGVLPGSDRTKPALALMAHYDSVWASPGAADDITGVASILEAVRALQTQGKPNRDLVVLITDAEELGLEGAEHFFATHPLRERIGTIINTEARGGGGRTSMFETSEGNGEAVRIFQQSVSRPATSSLGVFIYRLLPNDTDLTPALKGPYTAYNFAFIGRPGLYHSPLITADRLDQGSLQDMGAQVLDLSRALMAQDTLPQKSADLVFFDLFGLTTIAYAPIWGWVMLVVAVIGFGGAVRGRIEMRVLLGGIGRWLSVASIGGTLLYLGNLVSGADGPVQYYDRLAAIPRLEVMALLSCLAAAVIVLRNGERRAGDWAGFALPLIAMGFLGQVYAPTAAYVVIIPVMFAGLSALGMSRLGKRSGLVLTTIIAMLVTGYMIALGHQMMQGVGPGLPMVAVLPLVLALLVLLPIWPNMSTRMALGSSGVMLLVMVGIALWVRLDPIADTAASFARFS